MIKILLCVIALSLELKNSQCRIQEPYNLLNIDILKDGYQPDPPNLKLK